ncbi:MAG: hypothetical protein Q7R77_03770 [Candidatus Daviesbacteria bacterium]|nr:hypothetical protein [Candidatus Daviesbacteria bacterium]
MSQIYFNSPPPDQNDQIENFQTTLAALNQKIFSLQEIMQEKEQELAKLREVKKTSSVNFPYFFLCSCTVAVVLTFAFGVNLFSPFWEILLSAVIIAFCINYVKNFIQKFLGSK